jgi:hypothetical protein
MQGFGVITRLLGQVANGGAVHLGQPCRLSHPASFVQMLQNRQALLHRQLGAEQRRPLPFAEAASADPAAQKPQVLFAVTITNIEISSVSLAVELATRIETTKGR